MVPQARSISATSAGLPTARRSTVSSAACGGIQPSGKLGLLSGFLSSRFLRTAYPRARCSTRRRREKSCGDAGFPSSFTARASSMSQTTDASSKALTGRDAFWIHPDGLRLSLVQLPRVPALVERNASEASMRELLGRSRAACCCEMKPSWAGSSPVSCFSARR